MTLLVVDFLVESKQGQGESFHLFSCGHEAGRAHRCIPPIVPSTALCRVWSSACVAESSVGAGQGAKTSAGVDYLAPAQLHLAHNLILNT